MRRAFGGVDRQPIHQAPVRQRGLHVERAGNDDGVYRGAFKLGERQSLDRHTFGGDDRSTVKADGMPGVAVPTLCFTNADADQKTVSGPVRSSTHPHKERASGVAIGRNPGICVIADKGAHA